MPIEVPPVAAGDAWTAGVGQLRTVATVCYLADRSYHRTMQYNIVGEYLAVTRVTGPQHNLLHLRLWQGAQGKPECAVLLPLASAAPQTIDQDALVAAVLEGVAEANARLGTELAVTHIRYVGDDSRPESIYRFMASELVQHFAAHLSS